MDSVMDPLSRSTLPEGTATMASLPDELWLHIASYLDAEPPSQANFFHEPSLSLTNSEGHYLKNLSLVCRRWRRIAAPLLFRAARLQLDMFSNSNMYRGDGFLLFSTQPSHFLKFLEKNELSRHVKSLVLYTEWQSDVNAHGPIHFAIDAEAALFWQAIFNALNPLSIMIAAPPSTLALLLGVEFPVLRDKWAFDMPYHLFELRQDPNQVVPTHDPTGPQPRPLLDARNWTHMGYNEGSSIAAYSTYEYYAKMPPSLLRYLVWTFREKTFLQTSSLRSLTYVAIFPISDYVQGLAPVMVDIHGVRSFTLQLAPDPESGILDDPTRMKKALPGDLWLELSRSYAALQFSRWKDTASVVSRDYRWTALAGTLDDDNHLGRLRYSGWMKVGDFEWSKRGEEQAAA